MQNKRELKLQKRRREQVSCPTTKRTDLELEKYQATEKKLEEVKNMLIGSKCSIESFYIYQNQMDDHKTDILCESIRKNCSLRTFHLVKCTLR